MDDRAALTTDIECGEGPWFVLRQGGGNPTMRLDVRVLDRIFASDRQMFFEVDSIVIKLAMSCSVTDCARLAAALAPFTRSAPLREETYSDAKRRLEFALNNRTDDGSRSLYIDDLELTIAEPNVMLGGFVAGDLLELMEGAEKGILITLRHPRSAYRIRAALAAVVVAASLRPVEDAILLAQRIAAYEAERR